MNDAMIATKLIDFLGVDTFKIKRAWDFAVADEAMDEGRAVTLIRKYANKQERGYYALPEDFVSRVGDGGPAQPRNRPVRAAPPALVAFEPPTPIQSEQRSTVQETGMREFTRIRSSDLNYEKITVPIADESFVPFGVYKTLLDVLRSGIYAPVYIQGDSGYGKTMLVEQACAKLGRPLALINITNETSEDDLIGGLRIVDGDTVFEYGPVIRAYREGAVLLLDELDQGTSQIMCLQTIMQRKPYYIKKTGETIFPHKNFMVVATGNTKGIGDDNEGMFVGAQVLNEAFLERFPILTMQEAPPAAVEKNILSGYCQDEEMIEALVRWANLTREARKTNTIRREIQTRRLVHICINYLALGDRRQAIQMAVNRFDETTRDALIMLYSKIDGSVAL